MPGGSGSTRADVGQTLSATVAGAAAAAVAALIVARALGPSGQGQLQIVLSLATTCGQVFAAGVSMSLIQVIAVNRSPGREATTAGALVAAVSLTGCVAMALLGSSLAAELVPDLPSGRAYMIAAAILGSLYALQTTFLAAGRAVSNFRAFNLATLAGRLLAAVLIVGAVTIGEPRVGPVIGALIAANVACVAMGLHVARRAGRLGPKPDPQLVRPLFVANGSAYLGTLAQELAYRADVLLLAALTTTHEVGLYAIPLLLAELLWYLPNAAGLVLFTRSATGDATDFSLTAPLSATVFTLSALTAVAIAAGSAALVPLLLSDSYDGAVVPIAVMMPGAVALGSWKVIINDLVARGRPRTKLTSALLGAGVMLGLDLVLIPDHGATGAAIASSLGYLCSAAIALRAVSTLSGEPVARFLLLDRSGCERLWRGLRDPRELLSDAIGRTPRPPTPQQ